MNHEMNTGVLIFFAAFAAACWLWELALRRRDRAATSADQTAVTRGQRVARNRLASTLAEVRGRSADGVDELIGHIYDTDPARMRTAARSGMDRVLADRVQLNRRLLRIAGDMPDLAALPRQLEDLYRIEGPK